MRRAILALALLTTACAARGSSSPPDVSAAPHAPPTADARPTPSAQPAPAPEPTAAEDEPHVSGVEIVAETIKENDARALYELDIRYPQLARPRTPQERRFNLYARGLVAGHIREFKKYCAEDLRRHREPKRPGSFYFNAEFKVLYATPRLLSIKLTEEYFTGYLNADWYPVPLNYDLAAGRPLELRDLFRPRAEYLERIAAYCVAELERRGVDCAPGSHIADPKKFREGTRPVAENYEGWNLTRRGILITFGEYQIGPGCVGLVPVLVPYEQLRDVLRAGLPFEDVG